MTSLANSGHDVHYDINFLQAQLRDRPRVAEWSIQLLLCTVATLPQFWGPSFAPTCMSNIPSLTSFTCFCHKRRISTHAVCCRACIVSSSFDGLLYAEPGVCKFRHRVITLLSMVLFGKSLPISFVAAHHHGRRGVIPTRGESLPP